VAPLGSGGGVTLGSGVAVGKLLRKLNPVEHDFALLLKRYEASLWTWRHMSLA
jgi:hypothetical protein